MDPLLFHHIVLMVLSLVLSAGFLLGIASASDPEAEGKKYLEENKSKPGVVTLKSGLQYKVLREGEGDSHPSVGSPCLCHYSGQLLDGTVFDSSYERGEPTTFAPNQVIKGWTQAMQLMVEGDKWELYIPSDLAYGDHGSPPKIPGKSVLVFQMEILEIQGDPSQKVPAVKCSVSKPEEKCNDKERAYIEKVSGGVWDENKKKSELERLRRIYNNDRDSLKDELANWLYRRIRILEQMVEVKGKEEEDNVEGEGGGEKAAEEL